jgi:hypothetical protein
VKAKYAGNAPVQDTAVAGPLDSSLLVAVDDKRVAPSVHHVQKQLTINADSSWGCYTLLLLLLLLLLLSFTAGALSFGRVP